MRMDQILIALYAAREGSIKQAADAFTISRANASIALKNLEEELGYPIFDRTGKSVIITEKGAEFLKYAGEFEKLLQNMQRIKDPVKQIDLRILSLSFDFSQQAFQKFCEKYSGEKYAAKLSFKIMNSSEEATTAFERGEIDIAIALCRKNLYDTFCRKAAKLQLETEIIDEQHLEVTCKKGHPIINTGKIAYELFGSYPAFSSIQTSNSDLYAPYFLAKHGIDIKTHIVMERCPVRHELLKKMNGYLVSVPLPEKVKTEYGFESVAIKDTEIAVFAMYYKDASKIDLIQEYLGYCQEFM